MIFSVYLLKFTIMNREEKNAYQRQYRSLNNNLTTKKYEKTKKGFLMRLYRNMESRINGVQKMKFHLYKGKGLLSREDFYQWALLNESFLSLFDTYEKENYNRKLAPSVDRINSDLGYSLENMEWVTHSENSRRGSNSRNLKYNYKSKVNGTA